MEEDGAVERERRRRERERNIGHQKKTEVATSWNACVGNVLVAGVTKFLRVNHRSEALVLPEVERVALVGLWLPGFV